MIFEVLHKELESLGKQQKSIEQMYHQCTGAIIAIQQLLERLAKEEKAKQEAELLKKEQLNEETSEEVS